RIEMDVLSLEREESIISTNESLILNRLKAVERTLFAMEINVTKNLLTGESKVLSTATIPADELHQHTGLKVYDDGRKCVYAFNSQEVCASELSANEVEQLLRSATMHRKENHQNYCEPRSTRKDDYVSVGEEDLYCLRSDHNGNHPTVMYSGPAPTDRLPSPLFEDNAPYTILNAVNTTEPITAIFMGFQMAQDDRGLGHEFEGSLKAELVLIEDNEDVGEDNNTKENNNAGPTAANNYQNERSTNGNMKHTPRPVGPGIRKIQKKHRHCCTVC
uniref:Palmdelphin n=1 Tax=Labrus bergylta TaxID=56723 RepID=A0A3Q3F3P1_9LABR